MRPSLNRHLCSFDEAVPALAKLRNVSEHIDEYNLDVGRDPTVSRRQVQNWGMDSTPGGGLVWGWLANGWMSTQQIEPQRRSTEDSPTIAGPGFEKGATPDCQISPRPAEHRSLVCRNAEAQSTFS